MIRRALWAAGVQVLFTGSVLAGVTRTGAGMAVGVAGLAACACVLILTAISTLRRGAS